MTTNPTIPGIPDNYNQFINYDQIPAGVKIVAQWEHQWRPAIIGLETYAQTNTYNLTSSSDFDRYIDSREFSFKFKKAQFLRGTNTIIDSYTYILKAFPYQVREFSHSGSGTCGNALYINRQLRVSFKDV